MSLVHLTRKKNCIYIIYNPFTACYLYVLIFVSHIFLNFYRWRLIERSRFYTFICKQLHCAQNNVQERETETSKTQTHTHKERF